MNSFTQVKVIDVKDSAALSFTYNNASIEVHDDDVMPFSSLHGEDIFSSR